MADDSIPISEVSLVRLRELARWTGLSLDAALNEAIRDQCERKFWEATNSGYAALRGDPVAWAKVEQERRSLEGTLLDGLDLDEHWTEAGGVMPEAARETTS